VLIYIGDLNLSLTLQKSRVLQMQGVKDEAAVIYAEPLTTQQMRYHPAKCGKGEQPGKYHIVAGLHHVCVCQRRSINP